MDSIAVQGAATNADNATEQGGYRNLSAVVARLAIVLIVAAAVTPAASLQ